jgi:RNA polymerase sigma-70 factor (ECF subfamily)
MICPDDVRPIQSEADVLMASVAAGDEFALGLIYDRYSALVFGVASRVLGPGDGDIDDIVQATFFKLWRSARDYRSGNLAGLISRIAHNAAVDALRRRRALPRESFDLLAIADDASGRLFAELDRATVVLALADLPDCQRVAIELGFFAGLTHSQIADRTAVPLGTIKTRIRAGSRRLRDALTDTLQEPPLGATPLPGSSPPANRRTRAHSTALTALAGIAGCVGRTPQTTA